MAASTGHETRALLRAHLAAASGYRHLTHHCPICHRLLRLAMEPVTASQAAFPSEQTVLCPESDDDPGSSPPNGPREGRGARDESPSPG
ncbi:DUF6274 family protein [Streptomyces sp. NBC_01217]|uniref:DUF6274 family protein n=1 Tax=Streptomyces sp. NBC_01217 TaxID=2903779 RepID=UPI002E11D78A|nr:DUF6274 family protein [Streptomyces sp. NBC_01217]